MSESGDDDDDRLSAEVFTRGLDALPDEARFRHKGLGLFREKEAQQLDNLQRLVNEYLSGPKPGRPLSIAVFGAPGSGKSRLVKALPSLLGDVGEDVAPLAEINLTQVPSIEELASGLARVIGSAGQRVPFVFFDEFDARHAGAPWGWLSWFLAPMQDGEFIFGGAKISLKRAVLVFAGGTASTFEGFSQQRHGRFKVAKGPDFVSRLRGYVDIPGVNDDLYRALRRAAVVRFQLAQRNKSVDESLKDALLYVGRFKHGARSVEATIDLLPSGRASSVKDVVGNLLLAMHVDRGPLDRLSIGGCIGLSAGTGGDDPGSAVAEAWRAVSRALFREGATLTYGGRRAAAENLTEQLERAVRQLPVHLEPGRPVRIVTSTGGDDTDIPGVKRLLRPPVAAGEVPSDLEDTVRERWRASLELFRMRHQLALCSVAQFAIGGRLDPKFTHRTKRYPGVAEELMLAIAMGHPVYVAGGFEGGARWAGILLGLGRDWRGPLPGFDADTIAIPEDRRPLFRPPPFVDLPLTRNDLVSFLQSHALGGPNWIDNGLSADDNRRLFEITDANEIAKLVRRGLRAMFDPPPPD